MSPLPSKPPSAASRNPSGGDLPDGTKVLRLSIWGLACFSAACSSGAAPTQEPKDPTKEETLDLEVDLSDVKQTIRGFGASSAWTAPVLSDEQADAFFSVDRGLGLSLLRIQIKPSGESTELGTVDAAVSRGAQVWAAPWSPPAEWKSNGSTQNGGELLPAHYGDWAALLSDFAGSMQARGTPLLGVSAQNEPDFTAEWDTCRFTPEELAAFVGDHLGSALSALDPGVPVIAPEAANWGSIERFADALFDYTPARDVVLALATHGYGGIAPWDYSRVREEQSEIWLTEVSDEQSSVPDSGMPSALRVARMIHADLTLGNVSAWHYWWLLPRTDVPDTNAGLMDRNLEMTKRAYVLGQYSRFIRPGFVRVAATEQPAQLVFTTAYLSPDGNSVVVVLASDRQDEIEQTVSVTGQSISDASYFVTDVERSLSESDDVRVVEGEAEITLSPISVATLILELAD